MAARRKIHQCFTDLGNKLGKKLPERKTKLEKEEERAYMARVELEKERAKKMKELEEKANKFNSVVQNNLNSDFGELHSNVKQFEFLGVF
jgi:hypothetical protein